MLSPLFYAIFCNFFFTINLEIVVLFVIPKYLGFYDYANSETATIREMAFALSDTRKSKVVWFLVKNVIYFHSSTSSLI